MFTYQNNAIVTACSMTVVNRINEPGHIFRFLRLIVIPFITDASHADQEQPGLSWVKFITPKNDTVMKQLKWIIVGSFALLTACKSSHITSSWKAKDLTGKKYNKILVLGLIREREDDRCLQEKMENHLADDLRKLGYIVLTSLEEYGPKAFDGLSEKEALARLKTSGVDAVLTIVLLNKKMEKEFVPTNPRFNGNNSLQNRYQAHLWNYYGAIKNRVFEPGYYVDNTEYCWESNLY